LEFWARDGDCGGGGGSGDWGSGAAGGAVDELFGEIKMVLPPGIAGAISTMVGIWGMRMLLQTVEPRAREEGNRRRLQYGRSMRIFAGAFLLFLAGLTVLACFAEPKDWLLVGFFAVLIGYCALEVFRVRILFDEDFIYCQSPWRASRQIPWTAAKRLRFSKICQWHVLETRGHGRVRLSVFLSGIVSFREMAQRKMKERDGGSGQVR